MDINSTRRILLIENFASDFYKARLPLAKYLVEKGWIVFALIPQGEYTKLISESGITVLEYNLNRYDKGFFQLFRLIKIYHKIIKENDIDIVHSFRFQPNLLNVLSNLFNRKRLVLHITGLGIAFSNRSFKYFILRLVSQCIFFLKVIRANKVIVQNSDDKKDIWVNRFLAAKIEVIEGSGVNTDKFNPDTYNRVQLRNSMNLKQTDKIFICVTRLLWEKGIREMVNAFTAMRSLNLNIKLLIVGWSDKDNPRHVEDEYVNQFHANQDILFLGKKDNINELLALADVFIYPSYYREGIPRGILEALSMGLPVVTTNMPGCNLTVTDGRNGFIIQPKSEFEIMDAVKKIIKIEDLTEFSSYSRHLAISRFSDKAIFSQIEKIYYK